MNRTVFMSLAEGTTNYFLPEKNLHQPDSLLLHCHSSFRCPTCFPRARSGRNPRFCASPFPWPSLQRWWRSSYLSHTVGAPLYLTYHTSSQVSMQAVNTGQLWNISNSYLIYSNVMASCAIKSSSWEWLMGGPFGGLRLLLWGDKAILRGQRPSTTKYGIRYSTYHCRPKIAQMVKFWGNTVWILIGSNNLSETNIKFLSSSTCFLIPNMFKWTK